MHGCLDSNDHGLTPALALTTLPNLEQIVSPTIWYTVSCLSGDGSLDVGGDGIGTRHSVVNDASVDPDNMQDVPKGVTVVPGPGVDCVDPAVYGGHSALVQVETTEGATVAPGSHGDKSSEAVSTNVGEGELGDGCIVESVAGVFNSSPYHS